MAQPQNARRAPPPLTDDTLRELALRYVGKYATTRAKLCAYLSRKVRERGWEGSRPPAFEAIAARFSELGYLDDSAYALMQSRSLSARGYGKRRLAERLRVAGVGEEDGRDAHALADAEAIDAALRFAERRRLGPFARDAADPRQREKWIGALVRAGHGFPLARAIASIEPGGEVDTDDLRHRAQLADV